MRIREKFNPDKVFFTSDTHWHHSKICEYSNRPWGDTRTMDAALVNNWNNIVPKDGIVFHLGDFIFTGNIELIKELVGKLNGRIFLALGNHCYQNRLDRIVVKSLFDTVGDIFNIQVDNVPFLLAHRPFLYWEYSHIHLHGHTHTGGNPGEIMPPHPLRMDVGVDNCDYKPIAFTDDKIQNLVWNLYNKTKNRSKR
jgi:calcineurin-like phosphoesterase family protein